MCCRWIKKVIEFNMSVFGSKTLVFAPECWKCTVRSPDLKKFLGVGGGGVACTQTALETTASLLAVFAMYLKPYWSPQTRDITVQFLASLQKHTFLLTHHRWGTFRKERKGKSVTQQQNFYTDEVKLICPESGHKHWLDNGVVLLF